MNQAEITERNINTQIPHTTGGESQLAMGPLEAKLIVSRVERINPIELEGGGPASLAISCLVQPEIGDHVLCAQAHSSEPTVILSILSRAVSSDPLRVTSEVPIEVQAPAFNLMAQSSEVTLERALLNVGFLQRLVGQMEDIMDYVSINVKTVFLNAKRSMRRIEELDETQAGHLRLESPALVELHGEVTAISGEQLIKMQGQQIHMG